MTSTIEPRALVERLRSYASVHRMLKTDWELGTQAADALTAALDEINRLREALSFYSDPTYDGYDVNITDYGISLDTGIVIKDAGNIARAALKGSDQ